MSSDEKYLDELLKQMSSEREAEVTNQNQVKVEPETDKIMKAQQARGADFETGNLVQKAKNLIPLLVPLFISSFRRADELAMAMEARCYRGGEGRTRMKQLKLKKKDAIAFVVYIVFLILCIVSRFGPSLVL